MNCRKCGAVNPNDSAFCASCGEPIGTMRHPDVPVKILREGKNPFIATMLSFIPFIAAGQLYNRDFKKAVAIWAAYIVCIVISGTIVAFFLAFILGLGVWGWAIVDAYRVAKRETNVW